MEMEKLQKSVGGELLKMVCSVGWDTVFFYSLVMLHFLEQRLSKGWGFPLGSWPSVAGNQANGQSSLLAQCLSKPFVPHYSS